MICIGRDVVSVVGFEGVGLLEFKAQRAGLGIQGEGVEEFGWVIGIDDQGFEHGAWPSELRSKKNPRSLLEFHAEANEEVVSVRRDGGSGADSFGGGGLGHDLKREW